MKFAKKSLLPGRPKIDPRLLRDRQFMVRFTEDEFDAVVDKAEELKLVPSVFVRTTVLERVWPQGRRAMTARKK